MPCKDYIRKNYINILAMESRMSFLELYKTVGEIKIVNWDGLSINPTILDFEDVIRNKVVKIALEI